jgi:hypothetical protein
VHAAVAGCLVLAVDGAAACGGKAEGRRAGEVVGGHCCGFGFGFGVVCLRWVLWIEMEAFALLCGLEKLV